MNRFSISLLVIALFSGALSGCNGDTPVSGDPTPTTIENEWVTFTRTVQPEVGVNNTITVKIEVVAKQALELLAASDTLPDGVALVGGSPTSFVANASPNQVLDFEYRIKMTRKGTFVLTGSTRAKPANISSLILDLTSTITSK